MTVYQIDDVVAIAIDKGFDALTLDGVDMSNHTGFKIIQPLDNGQAVAISKMDTSTNHPLQVDVADTQEGMDGMHDIPDNISFIVLEPLEGSLVVFSEDNYQLASEYDE